MITVINARDCTVPLQVDSAEAYTMPAGFTLDLTGINELQDFGNMAYLAFNQWPAGHFSPKYNYQITLTGGDAYGIYDFKEISSPSDGSLYMQGLAIGFTFIAAFMFLRMFRRIAGSQFGGEI